MEVKTNLDDKPKPKKFNVLVPNKIEGIIFLNGVLMVPVMGK